MNNSSVRYLRKPLALLSVGLSVFAATAASAQTTNPASTTAPEADAVKLEKFVVTGSYIPFAGTTTAVPVTTINAQDIADTGVTTNILEVLRKASPQFAGNGNLGNSNANISSGGTGGGSAVAFRNTQTLVLLNGRRIAYAPILAAGGGQFVDVNLIPVSAVERVEILQDGASALYGTDAVSGVVNIILKTNYQGAEAKIHYGQSDNTGNYAQRQVSVVAGASNEKTSVTISAEYTRLDPLWQFEREFSNPAFGTPTFAGVVNIGSAYYILNPSLNAPPLNQDLTAAQLVANGTYIPVNSTNLTLGLGTEAQYAFNLANAVTLLLRNERKSSTVNVEHKVNDTITVFGDLLYSSTKTASQLNAQPTNYAAPAGYAYNPFDVQVTVRNRFTANPRVYNYDTDLLRGVVGIKGTFANDYSWEAGANKNIVKQQYRNDGLIDTATRISAVSSGALNYFARQQAAGAIDASGIFGSALGTSTSTLTTYDVRLVGEAFDLPAGPVGFAVGAEYRTETLDQTADRGSQTATFSWDSATTLDPFDSGRSIWSYFAEVKAPIFGGDNAPAGLHLVELGAAVRAEKYSDTEDPTVPKISLRWLPFDDQFAVRATYSESFAAPTLFQLFGPGGVGFTAQLSLARRGGGAPITGQANSRSGANPDLRPSESENYTFGVVYSPKGIKGLSLSADYFNIKQIDLVSTIGAETILQDVELNGTASPYASFVRLSNVEGTAGFFTGAPITAAGQIGNSPIDDVFVTDTLVNIAQQHLAGVDLKADYTWNADSLGRFDFGASVAFYDFYRAQTLPGTDEFETAGYATSFNGTIATWQSYASAAWTLGNWRANLGWSYIPSVEDVNADPAETDVRFDADVEAYSTFDVSVSYAFDSRFRFFKGMSVRLGANNVLNEAPPMAGSTFTESNADIATYNPIGRLFFVDATYKF